MANNIQDLQKRAKSISIISTGIILYITAGGNFTEEGAFLGGGIKFDHPEYLEYALIIIFIYSLFRYYLVNRGNAKAVGSDLINRMAGRRDFRTLANDLASKHVKELIADGETINNRSWNDVDEKDHPRGKFRDRMGGRAIIFSFTNPKIRITAAKSRRNLKDFTIAIKPSKFHYILIKNFRDFIRSQEDFWDKIFPYLLACGSIISIVLEIISRYLS